MKRALAATLFGSVLILFIPHVASAAPASAQHVVGYHSTADEKAPDAATEPKDTEPKRDAPGEGNSHYDRLHHDGDTF
ncbi:MAG TPA: hypothetical protein VGR20_08515 [Acidimicrobiia bacterium]|jgi:hypothetical protein|nr:hypothetical protein [Acidimicrobiia bacterium]